jgi:hypothetical protein
MLDIVNFNFKNINIRLLVLNKILFITGFLLSDPFHFFETSYEKAPKLLKMASKSDITSIKIVHDKNSAIELKKSESGWSVTGFDLQKDYPADFGKIESALEKLMEMRKYNEVTSNAQRYDEFEVGDKGLLVELKNANKVLSLYVGKQGSSFNTSLVRMKDDKTVYSVRGNLKADWNQTPDYFRIKQLFHLTKDNIKEIVVSGPINLSLKNTEKNTWSVEMGMTAIDANQVRANRMIDDLSLLEGTEFYNLSNLPLSVVPYGKIKITLKSNTGFNLEVNRVGNEFIAKSEQNPYWQKVPEYRIKSIFPEINEIKLSPKK